MILKYLKKYKSRKIKLKLNQILIIKEFKVLFSNLSSLSILELIELRKIIIIKLFNNRSRYANSKNIFLSILFIINDYFSAIIMLNTKKFKSNTLKFL